LLDARLAHELGPVARSAHDVVPSVDQQALERVPQDHLVFPDHDMRIHAPRYLPLQRGRLELRPPRRGTLDPSVVQTTHVRARRQP
jgi:hypothetical protein